MLKRNPRDTFIVLTLLLCLHNPIFAQSDEPAADPLMKVYRETPEKVNDLIDTRLDVRFDYKRHYLYGKEWVSIKPHLYATDSLNLDAKGMDIRKLCLVKNDVYYPLSFRYDSLNLYIKLDKTYQNTESYQLYIEYTAKPDLLRVTGSEAINDAKGLYFINSDGKDKNKPVQVWTQGESESSSAWFPTIDKPNQKTTEEIIMTVPAKYVSLSNGKLVSQVFNADSTRTDTWKMDLPHAPYLFMMAVGDFVVYKDKWRDKEVNYYLEPKYAPYAKDIFGFTPEVMEFYSNILGVDYPWNKYAQVVVRDYVSGAMENTTATLLGDYVQATKREMIDGSTEAESTIVHELFHQWFGDYVTTESWSNLTVNESFADFSESLWMEHKHGKDAGDEHRLLDLQSYLAAPGADKKPLVRFYYHDREDVLDVVTYQKGGCILSYLRNYLGDAAFFKGLNIYLKQNAFKTGEAQQVRLALEEASGRDLNWFFNQWYYGTGNPNLKISYAWDATAKKQSVYLEQTQAGQIFTLPMAIDIYAGGKKERHQIWMRGRTDTLIFNTDTKPDLVNVDADKIIPCRRADGKTMQQFAYQYFNAPLYADRYEAIDTAASTQSDPFAQKILLAALNDKYYGLQLKAIKAISLTNKAIKNQVLAILVNLARNAVNTQVKAAALQVLADRKNSVYLSLFTEGVKSESYAVQAASLNGIAQLNPSKALKLAETLENDVSGNLAISIADLYANSNDSSHFVFIINAFNNAVIQDVETVLPKINDTGLFVPTIASIKALGIVLKAYGNSSYIIGVLNTVSEAKQKQIAQSTGEVKNRLTNQSKCITDAINDLNKN